MEMNFLKRQTVNPSFRFTDFFEYGKGHLFCLFGQIRSINHANNILIGPMVMSLSSMMLVSMFLVVMAMFLMFIAMSMVVLPLFIMMMAMSMVVMAMFLMMMNMSMIICFLVVVNMSMTVSVKLIAFFGMLLMGVWPVVMFQHNIKFRSSNPIFYDFLCF